jgi:hypothetical protein
MKRDEVLAVIQDQLTLRLAELRQQVENIRQTLSARHTNND